MLSTLFRDTIKKKKKNKTKKTNKKKKKKKKKKPKKHTNKQRLMFDPVRKQETNCNFTSC